MTEHPGTPVAPLIAALREAMKQAVEYDELDLSKIGLKHWYRIAEAALSAAPQLDFEDWWLDHFIEATPQDASFAEAKRCARIVWHAAPQSLNVAAQEPKVQRPDAPESAKAGAPPAAATPPQEPRDASPVALLAEAAYQKACKSSQPEDWFEAALLLRQAAQEPAQSLPTALAVSLFHRAWGLAKDTPGLHVKAYDKEAFGYVQFWLREAEKASPLPQPEAREALRLDAERYRWLRDPDRCVDDDLDLIVGQSGGEDVFWREQLDKAIDNARRLNRIADPDFGAALSQGAAK